MNAIEEGFISDPPRSEQEAAENMAWGDNFLEINGVWYSKRGATHTRCNTCDDHTDQIFYQNEDDNTFITLCSCWTDSIMDRDPRTIPQRRS